MRTAISCCRVAVRAYTSTAMFSETTTSSSVIMNCICMTSHSVMPCTSLSECVYGMTMGRSLPLLAGNAAAVRAPTAASSACASFMPTPSARRPKTKMAGPAPRSNDGGTARSGVQ